MALSNTMMKERYILAAGSPAFSRKLAAIFQVEGWEAMALTNEPAAIRYSKDMQDVPQYLVIDKLKDWAIRLARELQPQGTQIILSGFMPETPEELQGILGVPYYSIMGLPSKAATVLLGKEVRDDEIFRRLSHRTEIKMMDGSIFDKDLQRELGLDGLVVFHKQGFNPMDVFTHDYMADPSPDLVDRTAVWSFGRHPSEMLVRHKLADMLCEVSGKGGRTIGISQVEFSDREGEIIDNRQADEMLLRMVSRYLEGQGSLLPIKKIYILIDQRCQSIPARTRACEHVYCRMFDKDFVESMGIDAIIDPIKRGFSESQGSWMGYIRNPANGVKLVSFMYDRERESALTVNEYKKMMNGLIDALVYQKAKVIATFPLYLTDEYGAELPRSKDDETVMAYLTDWLQRHPDKDVRLLYVDGYAPRN